MNMMRCGRYMNEDSLGKKHFKKRHGKHGHKFHGHHGHGLKPIGWTVETSDEETGAESAPQRPGHGHGFGRTFQKKNKFVIVVPVMGYTNNELNLKVHNGFLAVSGKHESQAEDGSSSSRQFTQTYKLPEDIDLASL